MKPFVISLIQSGFLFFIVFPATASERNTNLQARLAHTIQVATGERQWPCNFTGRFQQHRSLSGTSVSLTSDGVFFHLCKQGLLWETQKPITESVVYTHADQHARFRPGQDVKVLSGVVQKRIAALLLAIMGGDADALSEQFKLDKNQLEGDHLVLLPRSDAIQAQMQSITFSSELGRMAIEIGAANNGNISMQLSEFSTPTQNAVVACSSLSVQASTACKHLFDTDPE